MIYGICTIASIFLTYLLLLCWISGANDGINPACAGKNRGARLIQASPVYKLSYWLYERPQ